ncbi:MAG TPA: hypothetical protein VFY69_07730 [Solirubrobacterales bacterium]|nr:hypothetical protein [Solirubrobacterales bacterium]
MVEGTRRTSGNDDPELSPLVEPDAARKVGAGALQRFGETFDNAGKAIAAVAGAGVFFFGAGYFVEWQKFKRGGLPPDEILPLISQARIAAAGVRELAISVFFGALVLAVLGWGGVRLARWATHPPEDPSRLRRLAAKAFAREAVVPSAVLGALILLFVPLNVAGVVVALVLTLLLYYSLRLTARYLREVALEGTTAFPLWRLLIAAALAAVVLSGARQREFPEVRPHALVVLTNDHEITGAYISSDSSSVLIRRRAHGRRRPQLLILKRDDVEKVLLRRGDHVFPADESLFGRVFDVGFACIPPECRAGDSRVGISTLF